LQFNSKDKVFQMQKLPASSLEAITCPACGLLCDDVAIERNAVGQLKISKNGCKKSIQFFERAVQNATPTIAGKPATLADAVKRAAEILNHANQPLLAGLGTEVQGVRQVLSLADRTGATLDHMNNYSSLRNTLVLQNSGWQVTTLTEVRNRVDLLVIVGTDVVSHNPRFFERNVWNEESMFGQDTSSRDVVYLGGQNINTEAGISPKGKKPTVLPCDLSSLPEVIATLNAIVLGKKLVVSEVAGIKLADLENLAEKLKAAKYSVVTWVTSDLSFNHAELTVQGITELVIKLNAKTRSSGLPLGGSEGDYSVNQASTWVSGYPTRNRFARKHPEYDPYQFSSEKMLVNGEADALLWISSFNPDKTPPATNIPTIAIGHANMQAKADVFIPISTPGIDHKGTMFRIDSSVSLPLSQLRKSELPSLGEVMAAIEAAL
jgi:formylmethanofuran dehydrogenase subunit B